MREIEIKLKLRCLESVREKLLEFGWIPIEKLHQADFIYVAKELEFNQIKIGTPVTRLRVQNSSEYILNVKVSQSSELDCIEHETNVDNAIEVKKILQLLGLKEVMTVTKQRESGTLGHYTVCLDIVEGLGAFIEFEMLVVNDNLDLEQIRKSMFHDISKFNLDVEKEITVGYDTLLYSVKYKES